jgi:hypothetical protein
MAIYRRRLIIAIFSLIPLSAFLAAGVSQAEVMPGHNLAASARQWCDPLKVFLPEPGFKPLLASAGQLRANGFPPRPPASAPGALASWEKAVASVKHFSVPDPVCGTNKHIGVYSANWAGHVVPKADYSNSTFVQTQSQWTQVSVPGNSSYTNYQNAPDASFWDGIGISYLIQAGCDSIATKSPQYRCWTEDLPQNTIWEGPATAPGDLMYSLVSYLGGNVTYYFLENETTGIAESFDNSTPYVGSNAANFINERLNDLYLPNYESTYMSDNYFWQSNNTVHELTTKNNIWIMTSNCQSNGTVLSDPGPVSGGAFFLYFEHSSPYTNSC